MPELQPDTLYFTCVNTTHPTAMEREVPFFFMHTFSRLTPPMRLLVRVGYEDLYESYIKPLSPNVQFLGGVYWSEYYLDEIPPQQLVRFMDIKTTFKRPGQRSINIIHRLGNSRSKYIEIPLNIFDPHKPYEQDRSNMKYLQRRAK